MELPPRTPASAPEWDGPSAPNGNGPVSPVDYPERDAPAEKPRQARPSPWPLRAASPGPGPGHLPLRKPPGDFEYPDTPGTGAKGDRR